MKLFRISLVFAVLALIACVIRPVIVPGTVVLFAQSVPTTVTASWNANPAADNVTQYQVALDGGAALVVLPAACVAGVCKATVPVNSFGAHAVALTAGNLKIDSDPTTLQLSTPAALSFRLNPAAATPGGLGVSK